MNTRLQTLTITLIVSFSSIFAQVDTTKSPLLVITLNDSTEYVGRIVSSESKFLFSITRDSNDIKIPKEKIQQVIKFEDSHLARKKNPVVIDTTKHIEYTDGNLNRVIIFPTARAMKSWQGYVQLNELFFPFAAVGIGNFLTIGGGISLLPGAQEQILYFSPKITALQFEFISIAGGVFYLTSTSFSGEKVGFPDGFGVTYVMGTFGDKDKSITLGLGWGLRGEFYNNKPLLIVGGELKIGRNIKLITESWIPPESKYFLGMIGFRVIGKHISGDAVIMRPFGPNTGKSGLLPWFTLTYNFGYAE
jgi:hypothetical protein